MRSLILIYCCCFVQLIFSQNSESKDKCFNCKYEFKEFYYVSMHYTTNSSIVFMDGVTENSDFSIAKDNESFLINFYNNGYYTPSLLSFYRDIAKYCGDLFYNMIDYKSYYTKEMFFSKQISDKALVKNIIMKDGSSIQLSVSKIKGVLFVIDKNDENLGFPMSMQLDVYEMDNIQKIYMPYDIVVEDASTIKFNVN